MPLGFLVAVLLLGTVFMAINRSSTAIAFFLGTQVRATAEIQIHPVIGTYASFEVLSYVSDFASAFTSPQAADRAAIATGEPVSSVGPGLAADRTGANGAAVVSYVSSNAEYATVGLKAAAQEAARQVAESNVIRARLQLAAARQSVVRFNSEFSMQGNGLSAAPPGDVEAARKAALIQAADRVERRNAELVVAHRSLAASGVVVQSAHVTTRTMAKVSGRGVAVATVAGVAVLLTLAFGLFPRLRWRRSRRPVQAAFVRVVGTSCDGEVTAGGRPVP